MTAKGPELWPTFNRLRELPLKRQEELLVGFFTEATKIPHGLEVGLFITKLNNIPWYQSKGKPSYQELENATDEFFLRLDAEPLPLTVVNHDAKVNTLDFWHRLFGGKPNSRERFLWQAEEKMIAPTPQMDSLAKGQKYDAYLKEMDKHHLLERQASFASQIAWDAVGEALKNTNFALSGDEVMDPINYAATTTKWIVMQDEMRQKGFTRGNPGKSLFNGVFDKGYRLVGTSETSVIVMNMQPYLSKQKRALEKLFASTLASAK